MVLLYTLILSFTPIRNIRSHTLRQCTLIPAHIHSHPSYDSRTLVLSYSHTPILRYSHAPILPYSHTLIQAPLQPPCNTLRRRFSLLSLRWHPTPAACLPAACLPAACLRPLPAACLLPFRKPVRRPRRAVARQSLAHPGQRHDPHLGRNLMHVLEGHPARPAERAECSTSLINFSCEQHGRQQNMSCNGPRRSSVAIIRVPMARRT